MSEEENAKQLLSTMQKLEFCKDYCSVPKNKRNWGCGFRPVKYLKECPTLKSFDMKMKKEENKWMIIFIWLIMNGIWVILSQYLKVTLYGFKE